MAVNFWGFANKEFQKCQNLKNCRASSRTCREWTRTHLQTFIMTRFLRPFRSGRCSTLIAMGPVPHRATVSICDSVNTAKGDDLKQIVELPALNLSASTGLTAILKRNIQRGDKKSNSQRFDMTFLRFGKHCLPILFSMVFVSVLVVPLNLNLCQCKKMMESVFCFIQPF